MKKSIFALSFGAFGVVCTEFGVIGILPILAREFNVSIDTAGWLVGAFALVIAILGPFMTILTQRFNKKTILTLSLAVFAIANVVGSFSNSFTMLLITRMIPALFHPVYWALSLSVAPTQVEDDKKAQAIANVMLGLSVATVIGVPLAAYFADLISWQAAFWSNGILSLLAMFSIILFVPSIPGETTPIFSQIHSMLSKKILWNSLFGMSLMAAGLFASYSYLAEYLEQIVKMETSQISYVLVGFGVAGVLGNWLAGKYMSVNPNKTVAACLLILIAVHILSFFFGNIFSVALILLVFWGIANTMGLSVGVIRIGLTAPSEAAQLSNSLLASFANAGVTLGSSIGGIFLSHLGTPYIMIAASIFFLANLGLYGIYFGKKWW
jgi:predicted MFS family arabinose efflux permease